MLRARDFDSKMTEDLGTQRRRLRRQRLIETALPCALVAALLIAGVFTIGHLGHVAKTRTAMQMQATTMLAAGESQPRASVQLSSVLASPDSGAASGSSVSQQHVTQPPQSQQQQHQQSQQQQQRRPSQQQQQQHALLQSDV